ncbi:MAG: hypothetical protein WDN07_03285 [Actinomycetota bacterium]
MANSTSKVSRLEDKSINRDEELATTSSVLGRKFIDFPNVVDTPAPGTARVISVVNQKGGVGENHHDD